MSHAEDEALLVLWDIDGTLLSPVGGGNADYEMALRRVHPDAELPEVHTHGKTDRQVTHEYLEGSGVSLDDVSYVLEQLDIISQKYLTAVGRIPALAGVDETLTRVAARGYVNGLLTGNTPARAINKLHGAGVALDKIDWSQSFLGANAAVRPDITRAARSRFPGRRIVIIGDTPLDGVAAKAADLMFIGVTTGVYGADALWEAGAIAVIDDLVAGADALDEALDSCAE